MRLASHLEARPDDPWLLHYLGHVEYRRYNERAEELYDLAARGFARQGNVEYEQKARLNRFKLLMRRGNHSLAEKELGKASASAEASGDAALIAAVQIKRAHLMWTRGEDLVQALALLRRLEARVGAAASSSLRLDYQVLLGNVAYELGRNAEAVEAHDRAAETARRSDNPYGEASALYNLAMARTELASERGEKPPTEAFRQALQVAENAGHRAVEAKIHQALGKWLPVDEGRRHLERCVEIARQTRIPRRIVGCLQALAANVASESPLAALELLEEATDLAVEHEDLWALAYGWRDRMQAVWTILEPRAAAADALVVLDVIESLRDLQTSRRGRADVFSVWAEAYYWLSGRLLNAAQGDGLQQAFRVTERLRARVLLEAVKVSALAPTDPVYETLWSSDFATLEKTQAELADDEALLSFQLAPWNDGGGSWLLTVTRGGTHVVRLPDREAVAAAVQVFGGLIERRDSLEAMAAESLYRDLFAEALAALPAGVDKLILVPDGGLHLLPFGALRPSAGAAPLAARYQLTVVPSATLWLRWKHDSAAPARAPVLALADPALPDAAGRTTELTGRAGNVEGERPLGRLPHARREARAAVRHLGSASRLLMGAQATEALVKRGGFRGFTLLHFAAHALIDNEDPQQSGILLTPGSDDEDGLLQPREILDLDLGGRVVVLSACQSASGRVVRGEGVMSLARSFFQAGAHAVVGSLWRLRDDEAAAFFDAFYRHLGRGESVAAALSGAQRDRLLAGAPAAAWAGLVVLGDGEIVPLPGGRAPTVFPVRRFAMAGSLLLAALLANGLRRAWRWRSSRPLAAWRLAPKV